MQDRLPLYPGRVVLTPVSGQANTYDMTRADQPTQEGTPLNKASLLKDATAALFGLGSNAVPDDVLSVIRGPGAITEKVYLASSVVAGQVVDIIPPSELTPLENVPVGTVITLNESGVPQDYIVVGQGKPQNSSLYDSSCSGTWVLRKNVPATRYAFDSGASNAPNGADIFSTMLSFMSKYDSFIQSKIKTVKIPYCVDGDTRTIQSGANGLSCKLFPLSGVELGLTSASSSSLPIDGAVLSYFSGTSPDADAKRIAIEDGGNIARDYWTRSPKLGSGSQVFCIRSDGSDSTNSAAYGGIRGRPAFVFSSGLYMYPDGSIVAGIPSGTNIAITSGTPSQAIALQSGNAGDTIEVIYAGTVFVDWVTQGQQITSNGVKGAGILDGVLQVAGENSPGTKIVTGSYVGTGQSGPSNPNILDFDEPPKIIFIVPEINIDSYSMGILFPPYGAKTFIFGPSIQNFYRGLTVSLSGGTVKYYSSEGYSSQLNNSGKVFHYYALF